MRKTIPHDIPGIVTFRVTAHDENDIKAHLFDQKINVTVSIISSKGTRPPPVD
jgi:hypothetical protein